MKESTNFSPQKLAHLQQVAWQHLNEPGAYVEAGTGNLYRFPPEALIAGSSPVVRRENQDGGVLVQLSRDPFITTFEARMLAGECNIKPNFETHASPFTPGSLSTCEPQAGPPSGLPTNQRAELIEGGPVMKKVIRVVSVSSCVLTAILSGPTVLSAQIPTPPASETPLSATAALGIFAALLIVLGAGIRLYDIKRKHDEQGLYLQARVSDALLGDPELARLPVAVTVCVPFWRPAAALVTVSGRVPAPALREAAIRLALQRVFAMWPSAQIEDRIVVEPQTIRRAA